jgi:hypothetical protein
MGEAEESIVALARALDRDEDVRDLPGLVWRRGSEVTGNPWRPPENLDLLPSPDLDAIEGFDWRDFRYPMVTSRGCPFECIYCCVNKLAGSRKWRARSAANVVDELEMVARTRGVTQFEIWDDNFTLNLNRAKEICRGIIRRGLKLSWYCHNGIRADRVDMELARLMARAGCTSVAFGIESGNREVFDTINKGEPLSAVVTAVKTVNRAGIKAVGYFLIGLPGDTLDKFVESVRFQRSLPLMHYVFGMLIPYPKTKVWDIVAERGRFLRDIMETQHFSDGVVPVSFELPEFPRGDLVRAYYIARYFELYDSVAKSRDGNAAVIYLVTPPLVEHLPGMIAAAGQAVKHLIIGDADREALSAVKSFPDVDASTEITFLPAGTPVPNGERCRRTVVGERRLLVRHLVATNADIIVFDPARSLRPLALAKRSLPRLTLLPQYVAALAAFAMAFPALLKKYGLRKVREAAGVRTKTHIASLVPHLTLPTLPELSLPKVGSMKTQARHLVKSTAQRALKAAGAASFITVKAKLFLSKNQKASFPYDDHPSYM